MLFRSKTTPRLRAYPSKEGNGGKTFLEAITALALAALVLFSSSALAERVSRADIPRHSRVFAILARQGSEKAASLVDRRSLKMAYGFAEALAKSYASFEQNPSEGLATFFAVYDSLPQNVNAQDFAYTQDTLTIKGTAQSAKGYNEFMDSLREHGRFDTVSGEYEAAQDGVAFVIVCGLEAI
jgi:Tfp pilus assembly protein PilN